LTATQFHLPFYLSRLLPNTLATACAHMALGWWLRCGWTAERMRLSASSSASSASSAAPISTTTSSSSSSSASSSPSLSPLSSALSPSLSPPSSSSLQRDRQFGYCLLSLVVGCAVFRCDMVLLALPILLLSLWQGWVAFPSLLVRGLMFSAAAVFVSVLVDSFFWQRMLWPELAVLLFNTVDNRSSEWGTSPWHWYLTSALPRALLSGSLFVPLALVRTPFSFSFSESSSPSSSSSSRLGVDGRVVFVATPALVFVFLYSFLPHKELRFLFPVLSLFNACGAVGMVKCWDGCVGMSRRARYRGRDRERRAEGEGEGDRFPGASRSEPSSSTSTTSSESSSSISTLSQAEAALTSPDLQVRRRKPISSSSSSSASSSSSSSSSSPPSPSRSRSRLRFLSFLPFLFLLPFFVLNLAASSVFLYLSSWNYPGGYALLRLHDLVSHDQHQGQHALLSSHPSADSDLDVVVSDSDRRPWVHIDNWAAMTGVSRYGQRDDLCRYSKAENLSPSDFANANLNLTEPLTFTYLVSDHPWMPGFERVDAVYGFDRLYVRTLLKRLLNFKRAGPDSSPDPSDDGISSPSSLSSPSSSLSSASSASSASSSSAAAPSSPPLPIQTRLGGLVQLRPFVFLHKRHA